MKYKTFIPALILTALLIIFMFGIYNSNKKKVEPSKFDLNEVNIITGDKSVKFSDGYILVYVFSTKCQYCSDSTEGLQDLHDAGINILGVVIDESEEDVNEWLCKRNKVFKAVGKVTGSVSKNTSYLVVTDTEGTSSKMKKAEKLKVKIISKDDFVKIIKRL